MMTDDERKDKRDRILAIYNEIRNDHERMGEVLTMFAALYAMYHVKNNCDKEFLKFTLTTARKQIDNGIKQMKERGDLSHYFKPYPKDMN